MENVAGEWVTGGVAATILQMTLEQVQRLAKEGRIKRQNRRASHATTKAFWWYYLPDLQQLRAKRIAIGEVTTQPEAFVWLDEDQEYTSISDACRLLNRCSSTIWIYTKDRRLRKKAAVRFVTPYVR